MERMRGQLLTEMDGFEELKNVVVLQQQIIQILFIQRY
jgi:SpoVK/Ycf46/Vps4 family AAA+-type ATPase